MEIAICINQVILHCYILFLIEVLLEFVAKNCIDNSLSQT